MAALKTYDAGKVIVQVGPVTVTGFSDGDTVSVERNEDTFTLQVGTDGDGTRSKTNNRSGKFTLSVMQSSAANKALSAIFLLDELANSGVVPVLVKDGSGASFYAAATAWLMKPPTADFKREAGAREWVIETDNMAWFEGGN